MCCQKKSGKKMLGNRTIVAACMLFSIVLMANAAYAAIVPDQYEDDDDMTRASVISLCEWRVAESVPDYNCYQPHNLHDAGDKDWVQFYARKDEIYQVRVDNPGKNCNAVIEIYDKNGNRIRNVNDYYYGEEEYSEFRCTTEGVHYAMIRQSDAAVSFNEGTDYELMVMQPYMPLDSIVYGSVSPCAAGIRITTGEMFALTEASCVYYMPHVPGRFTICAEKEGCPKKCSEIEIPELAPIRFDFTLDCCTAPLANFSFYPTNPKAGQSVSFMDSSNGDITSRYWTFGDGGVSYDKNPTHTYTTSGNYEVSLTVSNSCGNNTRTIYLYAAPNDANLPVANFSVYPANPNVNQSVQFTDQSTGNITSRYWTFGDGGISYDKNPTHAYSTAGNYSVSLSVTGPEGSDVGNRSIYVSSIKCSMEANFNFYPNNPAVNQSVQFTDQSSASNCTISSWYWMFGDGGISYDKNPTHAYSKSGTYTVYLTVSNSSSGNTKAASITVGNTNKTGVLAGDFASAGLYFYNGNSWTQATPANPHRMKAWGNKFAASFKGWGLYLYDGSWTWIGGCADTLEIWGASLVAGVSGWGLYLNNGYSWTRIGENPENVAAWGNSLAADFGSSGLYLYDGRIWSRIESNPEDIESWGSYLAVDFGSRGLYLYNGTWKWIESNPEDMESWGDYLAVDLGSKGLYLYNGSWTKISNNNPESIAAWGDSLAADFGKTGLYVYNSGSWARITTGNPENIEGWVK